MPEHTPTTEAAKLCSTIAEVSSTVEEIQVLLVPTVEGTSRAAKGLARSPMFSFCKNFHPTCSRLLCPLLTKMYRDQLKGFVLRIFVLKMTYVLLTRKFLIDWSCMLPGSASTT